MINLNKLREVIMFEENITLDEMEQIFEVSTEELFDSIKALLQEAKHDTSLLNRIIERGDIIYGKLCINRDNQGIVNFGEKKYHISTEDIKDGLDDDMVLLEIVDKEKNKAKVKRVVERKNGLLTVNYVNNELTPVFAPFSNKIVLSDEDMKMIEPDDRLLIKVDRTEGDTTYCHLETIVGKKDDLELEEKTISVQHGFHNGFGSVIEKELDEIIPDRVRKEDYIGREDFTGEDSFTIDDENTQDIDDGLFLKELPNGHIIVGLPISHVSCIVPLNSAIFKEAA